MHVDDTWCTWRWTCACFWNGWSLVPGRVVTDLSRAFFGLNMKIKGSTFRLGTLLLATTWFCVFVALNTTPTRYPTNIVSGAAPKTPVNVERYGWPYETITFYSGNSISPELAETLLPTSDKGMLRKVNSNRPYRIAKNIVVFIATLAVILFLEKTWHSWQKKKSI